MKRGISLFLVLLLALSAFAGTVVSAEDYDVVTIMAPLFTTEAPTEETNTVAAISKLCGCQLQINWVPSDAYQEKINAAINGGVMDDVIVLLAPQNGTYINAARGGLFWDLTDKLSDYDFYERIPEAILTNSKLDGKNYFIPRTRTMTRKAVVFRKDWLEKLDFEYPTSMNDVYEIAKAFTYDDPDGNGKDDTYGLLLAYNPSKGEIQGFSQAVVWMGGGLNYTEDADGNLIPTFETQPYKDTMDWYRMMYEEGLVNLDFATITQEKAFELMNAEKGGIMFAQSDEVASRFDALTKMKISETGNESLTVLDIVDWSSHIETPEGEIKIQGGSGFYGGFLFPKSSVEDEEELDKLLSLFEVLDSADVQNIMKWGIEGVHYELDDDGHPVQFADKNAEYNRDVTPIQQLSISIATATLYIPGTEAPVTKLYREDQVANAIYAVCDPTSALISDTKTEKGAQLDIIIGDAVVQYIMGKIDEDGFQQAVDKWYAEGGTDVLQELNDAYALTK